MTIETLNPPQQQTLARAADSPDATRPGRPERVASGLTGAVRRGGDRQLWLCLLLTVALVLPRSLLIARAHSESVDDDYHLDHGLCHLLGIPQPLTYNDPPLGEVVLVLPLYLMGVEVHKTARPDSNGRTTTMRSLYHGQKYRVETLRAVMAAWKTVLFVPCVAVAFVWMRRVYGARSAWLAAALLLVEPTVAGHIPVAALDVLAMEMAIVASFLVWRYFQQPTGRRLLAAGVATAAAMLIKHTAILLPAAVVVLAVLHWFMRPWWQGTPGAALRPQIRPAFNRLAAGAIVVLVAMWPLTLFDVSKPSDAGRIFGVAYSEGFGIDDLFLPALTSRWPAGIYVGSMFEAIQHGREGHSALLWGEVRENGWWYYFFAVAIYKVPVGIALVMLLALVSLAWVRPRWDELFILVPALACGVLLCASGINIGFRHALPAYGMLLLLASRCLADGAPSVAPRGIRRPLVAPDASPGGSGDVAQSLTDGARYTPPPELASGATRAFLRTRVVLAWGGIAVAALHVLSYHPDYLSYVNAPWRRPWLAIGDSNLDWGQNLKQLNRWLYEHHQPPGKVIHFDGFDEPSDPAASHYLTHPVRYVPSDGGAQPTSGLLIVSPTFVGGAYRRTGRYDYLHDVDPVDVIGHSLLVYDLDALKKQEPASKDE